MTPPRLTIRSKTAALPLVFALAFFASASIADDRPFASLEVDAVVRYGTKDTFDEDIVRDCDWNRTLPRYLVDESEGRISLASGDTDDGRRLRLVTQTMHAVGGGGFTGPKWLVIEGTLTEAGRTIGTFEARRQTIRGGLTACRTLRGLGEAIGDDILEWLADPGPQSRLGDAK